MYSLLDIGIALVMFAVLTAPFWRNRRFDGECITCTVVTLYVTALIFIAAYSIRRPIALVVIGGVLLLYLFNFVSDLKRDNR
ncbi:MAG: hypothetical protein L0154_15120 [Chloroflexi bacterium]|nr:hypothetical protein [Chloroflexota bacterium]